MKILYQAEDGTLFEDEYECFGYEYKLIFPELFRIDFYDKDENLYCLNKNDIFDDDIYNFAEKIYVHSEEEVAALHKLALDCGWCEFDQITTPDIWVRKEDEDPYKDGKWNKCEVNEDVK